MRSYTGVRLYWLYERQSRAVWYALTFQGDRIPDGADTILDTCRLMGSNLPEAGFLANFVLADPSLRWN